MAGGTHSADKEHAWQLGRAGDQSTFDAWMVNRWTLPHAIKLHTIFYDAQNNTNVLQRYNAAEIAINTINMQGVPKKNMGAFSKTRWDRLKELVERTKVALPEGLDITDGPALFTARSIGPRKDLLLKQQRTYRTILDKVADLMVFVTDIYSGGIANIASAAHPHVLEMRAMEKCEFLKCMRGYSAGICHKAMHDNLLAKVNLVTHDVS